MFRLGINTGFAVNRYAEPEVWPRIVGEELGLKYVQLTADILNPDLPAAVLREHTRLIAAACERSGTRITSTFTGAFTRVNHLAHPDPAVREHWVGWFKRFVDLTAELGAESVGSHFGILTLQDYRDPKRRAERRSQNIAAWHEVGAYARDRGLSFISWEPMSIGREYGETIAEARRLRDDVCRDAPIPFKLCVDLDHGDLASSDPDDTDSYAWLRAFAVDAPQVHLKQTTPDRLSNRPFTAEHNAAGGIRPHQVVRTLQEAGSPGAELILELGFREREPADSTVVEVLKESVAYWRDAVPA